MRSGWTEKDVMNRDVKHTFWLICSLLFMFFCVTLPLAAQENRSLSLHFDEASMREVLDRIESQAGLSFSYSSRLIDEEEAVSLHLTNVSLENALEVLFRDRKVSFEVVERQIVLKKARRSKGEDPMAVPIDSSAIQLEKFTVSGYVKDAESSEVLIGATVSIPGAMEGTITNNYGFYSMTLRTEAGAIICSYVGYQSMLIPLNPGGNQSVHFKLEKEIAQLSEVTIYSGEAENIVRSSRSSEEELNLRR